MASGLAGREGARRDSATMCVETAWGVPCDGSGLGAWRPTLAEGVATASTLWAGVIGWGG
jgi:hypothetical protein